MLHELETVIGPDAMRTALHNYLTEYRFKIAEPSDLRAAFQAVAPTDLTAFWERWRNTAG
jgi:aminopeptidase N